MLRDDFSERINRVIRGLAVFTSQVLYIHAMTRLFRRVRLVAKGTYCLRRVRLCARISAVRAIRISMKFGNGVLLMKNL